MQRLVNRLKHKDIDIFVHVSKKLKYTICADEVIFQTLICNSKFKENIVNNNYRYIDWSDHINGLNNGNPNILTKKDYSRMIKSDKFFARKFDLNVDKEVFDMLDKYIDDK